MWYFISSELVPKRIEGGMRFTITTSSETSLYPRATRSRAHSLLPMPLLPMIRTPTPSTSTSTP